MQTNTEHGRNLVLIFSSLATIVFTLLGMTITWNCVLVFDNYLRIFAVFVAGILGFLIGALLFWRLTEFLSFKEVRK